MALRAEYTLHQSRLGDFLYASIWEGTDGASLSVLSMLARLDFDPWAEAARLAALPRQAAVTSLAAILARVPWDRQGAPDDARTADRLVGLLPAGDQAASAKGADVGRLDAAAGGPQVRFVLVLMVAIAVLLAAGWLP